ncbi:MULTISPECIES: HRDC domain-containing protein [Chryseobacterium group]|uniref:HRDC domain-containing protein n=1 Tax=Chryseobacterium group TaxID=2782232 RepID=UPI000B4DC253|nr:HRDC domain-containing protein [Chryseobacterium sp. VAUSW3]OWR13012.1 aldolase [Chryseobacterium sp. VAUSW3]
MKVKVLKVRLSDDFIEHDQKVLDRFLRENNVLKFESAFVKDDEGYWSVILYYEELKMTVNDSKTPKYSAENDAELNADEIKILDSLKLWRTEKAKDQNLPVYFIATNKELLSIAKYKPVKKEELLDIKGFGKHKIENYGEEIIEILESV